MNDLVESKIRFGDAARAVGINRNTLRNWFDRNDIVLLSARPEAGWAEFTLGDIAALAVMRRLVRWGIPVDYANEIAVTDIFRLASPLFSYRNTPAAALLAALNFQTLAVYYREGELEAEAAIVPTHKFDLTAVWREAASEGDMLPAHMQDVLQIDLRSVVAEAFERLGINLKDQS